MSDEVSARPANLNDFHDSQTRAANTLARVKSSTMPALRAFFDADDSGCADSFSFLFETMTALVNDFKEIPEWVGLVHDALVAADGTEVDGVRTVSAPEMALHFQRLAGERGIDLRALMDSHTINFDRDGDGLIEPDELPQVGTMPEMSGFVNDPVCTATGHLLVDSRDFMMPPRLDVLSFHRTYASVKREPGAFGPGWWTWTECHAEVLPNGSFLYHGPDGLQFEATADGVGGFVGHPELDVLVEQTGDDRYQLRWGRRSRYAYQRWTFASGRLVEVTGPFIGTNSFEYTAHGLSRIVHDSGRALTLRWRRHRVVAIESSDGRIARFTYDRKGHLIGVDNALSAETYEVDDNGLILSITDADGVRTVANVFDADGRVVEQVTATDGVVKYSYDAPRRTTISDGDDNPLAVYTHDDKGRVELYATGGGFRFTRRFDVLGRVVSQRDPDGTSFTRDELLEQAGRTEEVRWSTGAVDRYTYDHRDRLVAQSSPARSTTFEYADNSVFPSRISFRGGEQMTVALAWMHGCPTLVEDGDGVAFTLEVRPDGTIASATNAYGATTRFDVHPSGGITRMQFADGRVVEHRRDDAGRIVATVDAAGNHGELRYSPAGRLLTAIDPTGAVTALEYDDRGMMTRQVAADGVETRFVFDEQQRPIGVRFANGDTVDLTLDEFGRQIAVEVAGDRWITERDPSGRVVKRIDPTGTESTQTYGEMAGWSEITDAAGETSRVEMDLARRVTALKTKTTELAASYNDSGFLDSCTTGDGVTTKLSYTPGGRVSRVDGGDTTTEYRYDDAGHFVGINTGTGWWTFDRDEYGRVTRRVSPAGREQRFRYDVLGRVRSIEVDGAEWRFAYDPMGRITATTDPTGRSKTFVYDAIGRMVESVDGRNVSQHYEYDLRGRIAAMADDAGGAIRYEHSPSGKLTSVTDQLGRQTVVTYDAAGRHVATDYFDGDGTPMTPDPLAGVHGHANDTSVDFGGYTPLARTESADRSVTRWTLPSGAHVGLHRDADGFAVRLESPGFVRTFERDACGRIVEVTEVVFGRQSKTSLRRDGAGRVIEQAVDGAVTTYSYDEAGQLVRVAGPDGIREWEYDALGRIAAERGPAGERRYEYDQAHQLIALTEGDEVTTFEYDARGRRIRARGRHDVAYVWARDRLEAVVTDGAWTRLQFDAAGRLARIGNQTVSWSDDEELPEPELVDGKPVISFGAYTFGSVDNDGSLRWRPFRIADAWGGESDVGTTDSTSWHDYFGVAVDGLVWLGVRPYDIATRQFLAPDPLAPVPGVGGSTSPYTYACNDPINIFDPTGREGQFMSREQFEDLRDRRTGVQWGNVVRAVGMVAVAVVVVATAGAGAPLLVVATAAAGTQFVASTAAEGTDALTNTGDGSFTPGQIVMETTTAFVGTYAGVGLTRGLTGPLTGAITRAGSPRVASAATPVVVDGASSLAGATFSQGYEAGVGALGNLTGRDMRPYLGGDGEWNWDQLATDTAVDVAVGRVVDTAAPHVPGLRGLVDPHTSAPDPSTTRVNASPAPDMPTGVDIDSITTSGGDSTSSSGGESTSTSGGDSTSTAGGESTSSSGGESTSTSGGDSTSTAGGDSTSTSGGDPSSTSSGDSSEASTDGSSNAGDTTDAGNTTDAGDTANAGDADSSADSTDASTTDDGLTRTTRTYGDNTFEFTADADGVTRSAHFEIQESASGLPRSSAETSAQSEVADQGQSTDQGGHIIGHRFASNQGDINMFPQDAQFNNSAYRTLENEIDTWVDNGFHVEGQVDLNGAPGSPRPDAVTVDYVVTNPETGEIVHWRAVEFENQAGQTFDRVPTPEVRAQHDVEHDLHMRPDSDVAPADATSPNAPNANGAAESTATSAGGAAVATRAAEMQMATTPGSATPTGSTPAPASTGNGSVADVPTSTGGNGHAPSPPAGNGHSSSTGDVAAPSSPNGHGVEPPADVDTPDVDAPQSREGVDSGNGDEGTQVDSGDADVSSTGDESSTGDGSGEADSDGGARGDAESSSTETEEATDATTTPTATRNVNEAIDDFRQAFDSGGDTSAAAREIADLSTHTSGTADRVVLGRWAEGGGYVGEAETNGGIYYETEPGVWEELTHGLPRDQADQAAWQVNEAFLRARLEEGVGRIDLHGESIDEVRMNRPNSFTARELKFLFQSAPDYGYVRDGNSWVLRGDE